MSLSSSQILAGKTEQQLRDGIARASAALGMIDFLEGTEDYHQTFERNSRAYEDWREIYTADRHHQYALARALCEQELAYRHRGTPKEEDAV